MKSFSAFVILAAAFMAACQAEETPNNGALGGLQQAECSTDADCAAAGCSGQVCTTAEEAPDVITTCEYREEYRCLELTNCGCIEGKCAWAQTPEYAECLAEIQPE